MAKDDQKLQKLRDSIDSADKKLLELLNKRATYVLKVGELKAKEGREYYAPDREAKVYKKLTSQNKGPFPNKALKSVYREIMSASLSMEKPLKVAFLGPKATFTHQACLEHFGSSGEYEAKKEIADVFEDVERGRADLGVVPIENSTEGVVNHTLDLFTDSTLKINAEILLSISLSLMNKTGKIKDIKKVCSHPHAIAQCSNWLRKNLSKIPALDVESTASAAQTASMDKDVAAIASTAAASLYDLRVVESKIEDNSNNFTRFLVIGKKEAKKTGKDKTSIMFAVKDTPGALYNMLKPFASRKINLTKIESRPSKKKAWEYIFFLDVDGHSSNKNVKDAIIEFEKNCSYLKVLGSYPTASRR